MILLTPLRAACPRCQHAIKTHSTRYLISLVQPYSTSTSSNTENEEYTQDFSDIEGELRRRKRKADSKRRQYGNTFVDHVLVTVRGGKGGSGAAALQATLKGSGPSAPCGGNGGSGGSVYLTTSPSLTSLSTLKKRVIGGPGINGSGAFRHGKRGEDVLITVPIGTIVKEIKREGEEERSLREEEELNLTPEEKIKKKWKRWIITHPSTGGEVSLEEYKDAEILLKKEGRWNIQTPTFDEIPPIEMDIEEALKVPVLLSKGGLGGLGNPFFASPRVASKGFLPPTQTFQFELKLISDVGLVGFPNSGKSTLLRSLTGKKTEIANYQFTTLNPQIGVVRVFDNGTDKISWANEEHGEIKESWQEREEQDFLNLLGEPLNPETEFGDEDDPSNPTFSSSSINGKGPTHKSSKGQVERIRFTISDNPGLLELASENIGLGHSFLRSIERSPILIYVLDFQNPSPKKDLEILKNELENYKSGLSHRTNLIVLNKADRVEEVDGRRKLDELRDYLDQRKIEDGRSEKDDNDEVVILSSKYNLGMENLVRVLVEKVELAREQRKREIELKEKAKLESKKGGSFGLKRIES